MPLRFGAPANESESPCDDGGPTTTTGGGDVLTRPWPLGNVPPTPPLPGGTLGRPPLASVPPGPAADSGRALTRMAAAYTAATEMAALNAVGV